MENNENQEVKEDIPSPDAAPISPILESEIDVSHVRNMVTKISDEVAKVLIGNEKLLELMMAGIFTGGHILMEGVPGIAKTLTAKLIAQCLNIDFKRVQFTPDLMPSDLIGVTIFNMQKSEFTFKKGPLFTNLVLIDEINRSPAKTQAALFEAMEEKQISVDGETYHLNDPFIVVATQNPIEQEGTYKLPEAQLDRFVFKLNVDYPSLQGEVEILQRFEGDFSQKNVEQIKPVLTAEDLLKCYGIIEKVHIKKELLEYIATIVHHTRNDGDLFMGASPRASMAIMKGSKAMAAIKGRGFVTPDDIQAVCYAVLNHRIVLSPEKEMEGVTTESLITEMLKDIEVPR